MYKYVYFYEFISFSGNLVNEWIYLEALLLYDIGPYEGPEPCCCRNFDGRRSGCFNTGPNQPTRDASENPFESNRLTIEFLVIDSHTFVRFSPQLNIENTVDARLVRVVLLIGHDVLNAR